MLRFLVPERFEGLNEQSLTNDQAVEALVRKYIQSYKHKYPDTSSIADENDRSATETLQIGGKINTLYALSRLYFQYLNELVDSEVASRLKLEIAQGIGEENLFRDKESSPEEDQQKMIRNLLDYVEYTGEDGRVSKVLTLLKIAMKKNPTRYVLGDFEPHDEVLSIQDKEKGTTVIAHHLEALKAIPSQHDFQEKEMARLCEFLHYSFVISKNTYRECGHVVAEKVNREILDTLKSAMSLHYLDIPEEFVVYLEENQHNLL